MIDYGKFQQSLRRLEEQNETYQQPNTGLPSNIRDAIAESVIRRFGICYDRMWKVLKRYLAEKLRKAGLPNSPRPILRLAYENDLLDSPLDQWFRYADARTGTLHDSSIEKAKARLELVPDFIDDAISLYETMTGTRWKQ